MRLRVKDEKVKFGPMFCAVGARGVCGEGFPFHRYWRCFGMDWRDTTLQGKTITMERVVGNMPLREDGVTPKEFRPACIYVDFLRSLMHNAVGFSNFGAPFYLSKGWWQQFSDPFVITFKAICDTLEERLEETREFITLLSRHLPFKAPAALEWNWGCPNVKHESDNLVQEIGETHDIAAPLGLPQIDNFSVVAPPELLLAVAQIPDCDALAIVNTIEWGHPSIDWEEAYGIKVSPMVKHGFKKSDGTDCVGGYSGSRALSFSIDRIKLLREAGVKKPLMGGNGIRRPRDITRLRAAGASDFAYGSGAVVATWNMRSVINCGNAA